MEQTKVVFYEGKGKLMRRRKKGLTPLHPDPLEILPSSTVWLQKNNRSIFGRMSNDKRRPTAKVLCLVGNTKIGEHRSELYTTIGQKNFLCIKRKSPVLVIKHKKELCSLVKHYIELHGKKTSLEKSPSPSSKTSSKMNLPKRLNSSGGNDSKRHKVTVRNPNH